MGLIADIAEVMKNLEENGERATPETVLALAVWKEVQLRNVNRQNEKC